MRVVVFLTVRNDCTLNNGVLRKRWSARQKQWYILGPVHNLSYLLALFLFLSPCACALFISHNNIYKRLFCNADPLTYLHSLCDGCLRSPISILFPLRHHVHIITDAGDTRHGRRFGYRRWESCLVILLQHYSSADVGQRTARQCSYWVLSRFKEVTSILS